MESFQEKYDEGFKDGVLAAIAEIRSVVQIPEEYIKAILEALNAED